MFGDIAKSFGRSFLIAALAPAVLFVGVNVILVAFGLLRFPNWWISWQDLGIQYFDHKIAILFLVAVFLALGLQLFGTSLIQLYEGYFGRSWFPLSKQMASFQEYLYKKRIREIELATKRGEDTSLMEHDLSRDFAHEGDIFPTKLGNVIRAFEYYARKVYNIDPITGWVRITAVIPNSYKDTIEKAQTDFNAVLNISFLSMVLGIECLIIPGQSIWPKQLILSLGCFVLSYGLYRVSCSYAQWWGEYVRSAFDLYRYDLLKQMGISLPSQPITLRQEKGVWGRLQEQTFYVIDPGETEFLDELKFLPPSVRSKQTNDCEE